MSDTLSARRAGDDGPDVTAAPLGAVATRSMRAIGTTGTVAVTAAARADRALELLGDELAAIDLACSRFREDSEVRRVERHGDGRPVRVGPLLFDALETACAVAVLTSGIVDPTVGSALAALGYDRDFDEIDPVGRVPVTPFEPAPGWWRLALDPVHRTIAVPSGVHIDLGSTAKAFAADRAAARIAAALGCGVLVNLGGDVSVSGPSPEGGWAVGIASDCTAGVSAVDQVVALSAGALATSGTTSRSWRRNGETVHHIIDPWTGGPAPRVWSLVSTTATSCVEANAWSTAAIVWGEDAIGILGGLGVCARLVRPDGSVVRVGGWPDDEPKDVPRPTGRGRGQVG